jgi:hypothetical protein
MERKSRPANLNFVFMSQSINTHGTEITPGSNVVGKDLKDGCLRHG